MAGIFRMMRFPKSLVSFTIRRNGNYLPCRQHSSPQDRQREPGEDELSSLCGSERQTGERRLIVNADDFGHTPGVNRGIIQAHDQGIVTSASLMVRWPAAAAAAAYSRERKDLSLGLHLDLGQWGFRNEAWVPLYSVVSVDDEKAVRDEIDRQLFTFRKLVGRDPSHLDSHQHVHRSEPVRSILVEVASRLGIPLRDNRPEIYYCGDFYGRQSRWPCPDAISPASLIKILSALPPGITELGCHPGNGDDVTGGYRDERALEVKTLCDPSVRQALHTEAIELGSFYHLVRWLRPAS